MKFCFKFFVILVFFILFNSTFSHAESLKETYVVEFGNIDIGKLSFYIDIDNNMYNISIKLKNKGLLSGLYKFQGNYEAEGYIKNGNIIPLKYSQLWVTKKKKRIVNIFFNNRSLSELNLFPEEKEFPRIEYIGIKNYFDPLSSFLNILIGAMQSKTIDGRRVYSMVVSQKYNSDNLETKKILIEDYVNIWTDHKRNDLEYIEVKQENNKTIALMPVTMKIKFKGMLYNLTKI